MLLPLLLLHSVWVNQAASLDDRAVPSAREMYDSISNLTSGGPYPDLWWEERSACLASLAPGLETTMDRAWQGMRDFWGTRGSPSDTWKECGERSGWFEYNCTRQRPVEMDIWEPCNYASNLAYDRLMLEVCLQEGWSFPPATVSKIAQAFGIVTFGSSFMHGSNTHLGASQDLRSNDLLAFIIHQAGVANIPYDPIIHDLAFEPRPFSGEEAVDRFHDIYNNHPVEEWDALTNAIVMPSIQGSFTGIFGYVLTLLLDADQVDAIAGPLLELLGVSQDDMDFMLGSFLPAIRSASSHRFLGLRDRLHLLQDTIGTAGKLLYAFVWQEKVIDFGGANLTPEANAAGAALLPYLNELANSLTSWSLHVSDIQRGEGYPGWAACNPVIPHAKWHVQTAASLADAARLMDWVLGKMQ